MHTHHVCMCVFVSVKVYATNLEERNGEKSGKTETYTHMHTHTNTHTHTHVPINPETEWGRKRERWTTTTIKKRKGQILRQ